jgi:hypothetical protein
MAQVSLLKARARQLAAEDDFTLLFSFGRCDWWALLPDPRMCKLCDALLLSPVAIHSELASAFVGVQWQA